MFSTSTIKTPVDGIYLKDSVNVKPYETVKVTSNIVYKNIKTNCILFFRDIQGSDSVKITGKWQGSFPVKLDLKTSVKKL